MRTCFSVGLLCLASMASGKDALPPTAKPPGVKEIILIHLSHTDVGFTDHPLVCRELYRRYLDVAVDAVLDTMKGPAAKRFFWTAETTLPVNDWWQAASAERKAQFLAAVRSGQLDVAALAVNNAPFQNAEQWQTMVHWLPEDLWREVRPQAAIQDDVNGVPRAGAMALLDRGVRYLWTGINGDSGGAPFPRYSAFWWRMPDGRRMFVWIGDGYASGYDFFEPAEWRRGPVPAAADTRYRPPREGELFRSDEASLRAAHRRCLARIRDMEKAGYPYDVVAVCNTNQWRMDNDPPFPPLADFVAGWNRLGLEPRLRLTTVSDAMRRLQEAMGATAPEYAGEWTDWWANGAASSPRELAASRAAKRRWPPPSRRCGARWTPTAAGPSTNSIATSACSTNTPGARRRASPNRTASTPSGSSPRRAFSPIGRWPGRSGSSRSGPAAS